MQAAMKIAVRILSLVSLVCALALGRPQAGLAKVRAWQGTITIPTYPWEDDPYPKFQALEDSPKLSITVKSSITYPYTMQDHLLRSKVDRTYKALFLENEYLKITCLPELGGRLYSVLDKTEGKEMFHLNRVIKPGMIALRGAFISGGVEWNAGPQGHTVTVCSPVDALPNENADGSAYLEISNQEMICRTRWTVRVTLHPGRSYLDEQIRISNPTDTLAPYYFWNCTAFPNRPGTRFIYPMRLATDHFGRKFFAWPVSEGKDLSWLKNYDAPSSVFAVGCDQDFFGAYDVEADRGIVATAHHHELPGKKGWTWGNSDFGLVAQKNLTDQDGPYIEVQSGPLPTQADYGLLAPRDQVAWQEWWYPVHGLGQGFQYANRDVAVEAVRQEGTLRLRILATGDFPDASYTLSWSDTKSPVRPLDLSAAPNPFAAVHFKSPVRRLDLSPAKPEEIVVPAGGAEPVHVSIRAQDRRLLAQFTVPLEMANPAPPKRAAKPDEQLGVEELYLQGERAYREIDHRVARRYCEKALAKDPGFAPALRLLGGLDLAAGLYERARERLGKAVERLPDDGLSWYFLGVAHLRREGREPEALTCGYRAARCGPTASIGYDLAGRAHLRLKQPGQAVTAFRKAVAANPRDGRAKDHLALALYAEGKADGTPTSPLPPGEGTEAWQLARQRAAEEPTDLLPRAILAMQDDAALQQFVKDAQAFVGEYEFNMLETSLALADVGMTDEAGRLLYAACVEAVPPAQRTMLPQYYLAYFARLADKNSKGLPPWQKAALSLGEKGDSPHLCEAPFGPFRQMGAVPFFPSRPEELAVFEYCLAKQPDDGLAHFALGNLLAHFDRMPEAVSHWKEAVRLAPNFAEAWRNLGLAAWKGQSQLDAAQEYYRRALALRPNDQTLYRDLAEILLAAGKRPEAIRLLVDMPIRQDRRSEITILLAQAYLDAERYDDALKLLEATPYFVNWEGQDVTWAIFNQAHVKRGERHLDEKQYEAALADFQAALTYPANLNVGRSSQPAESHALYGKGRALVGLRRVDEARAAWQQGAALPEVSRLPETSPDQPRYHRLCKEALAAPP
jgi:tetratricopeptide (TPR) repeat protein